MKAQLHLFHLANAFYSTVRWIRVPVSFKGQCMEIFDSWFFSHKNICSGPLIIRLKPLCIYIRIREEIRNFKYACGVNDTAFKMNFSNNFEKWKSWAKRLCKKMKNVCCVFVYNQRTIWAALASFKGISIKTKCLWIVPYPRLKNI
jgi:hypothetical protein